MKMREVSDRLCLEYGLSVVKHSQRGKTRHIGEIKAESEGKQTVRGIIRRDMDVAIEHCFTYPQFVSTFQALGYTLEWRGKYLRTNSQGDGDSRRDDGREAPDCGRDGLCDGGGDEYGVANEEKAQLNDKVRKVVGEILDVCEGTFLNLSAVVALRICEDTIPHRRYQGVRHDSGLANH